MRRERRRNSIYKKPKAAKPKATAAEGLDAAREEKAEREESGAASRSEAGNVTDRMTGIAGKETSVGAGAAGTCGYFGIFIVWGGGGSFKGEEVNFNFCCGKFLFTFRCSIF